VINQKNTRKLIERMRGRARGFRTLFMTTPLPARQQAACGASVAQS
jgi:hypothetical protein